MTVSSIVPVNNHTGNSSTKIFDFDFLIENESELVVHHIDVNGIVSLLENGVDYSITEVGNKNGSNITFPLASSKYNILAVGEHLSLSLDLQIKQESEFHNSSYFNLEILEWTFDYIVRILQILNRKVERCIKVEETDEVRPEELIADLYDTRKEVQSSYESVVELSNEVKANLDIVEEKAELTSEQLEQAKNEVELAKQEVEKAKEQVQIATQKAQDAASMPIGSVVSIASSTEYVPEGYLSADGSEYSKSQFEDLYENYLTGGVARIVEENWQTYNTSWGHKGWNGFAYGDGVYVVVGNDGFMSKSTDGLEWTNPSVPSTSGNKSAVAYGDGTFIATANGSTYFMKSTDKGNSWTYTTVKTTDYWYDIKFGNGVFVAVSMFVNKIAVTSNRGSSWTEVDHAANGCLAFGNGKFVIMSPAGYVSTSTDGLSWTKYVEVLPIIKSMEFDEVNKHFVAVTREEGFVFSSIDGLIWEQIGTVPKTTYNWFKIGGGKAVIIVNSENTVYETTDYINWTPTKIYDSTSTSLYYILGYGGDKFVVLRGGSSKTYYKTCYTETITLLNTCSYTDYELDIENYGECAKFAVDNENLKFRVPLLKETETTDKLFKHFVVVANGQTNQSMMDWSAWASSLQGKANADLSNCTSPIVAAPYIVEVSDKSILPSWYRVYSDGWCEQGGHLGTASATKYTVSFLKEFVDTNYSLVATDSTGVKTNTDTDGATAAIYLGNYTTSSFYVSIDSGRQESSWVAKGFIN